MALYDPPRKQLGKNAIRYRVEALRLMNQANGPQYRRYSREGTSPTYQVETTDGAQRDLATRDVPAYVVGAADAYTGMRPQLAEVLDEAMSSPDVIDRDTLVTKVLALMDARVGDHLAQAAATFLSDSDDTPAAAVA